MLREGIMDLCGQNVDGLGNKDVLGAASAALAESVAGIIDEHASSLLQSLK